MNLGMLLTWEQLYLLNIKDTSPFNSEDEMIHHLTEEKGFSEFQIKSAYTLYNYAMENFNVQEWKKVDELFDTLERGRTGNIDVMMGAIGEVLWEMGNMFGTNPKR